MFGYIYKRTHTHTRAPARMHTRTHARARKHMGTRGHTSARVFSAPNGDPQIDIHKTRTCPYTYIKLSLHCPTTSAALRVPAEARTWYMFDTAAVFQSAIGPYVVVAVVGSFTHDVAASFKFASVMPVSAATCVGSTRSSARRPARRCDRNATTQLHRKRHHTCYCTTS